MNGSALFAGCHVSLTSRFVETTSEWSESPATDSKVEGRWGTVKGILSTTAPVVQRVEQKAPLDRFARLRDYFLRIMDLSNLEITCRVELQ
jgi:hypothetical protein